MMYPKRLNPKQLQKKQKQDKERGQKLTFFQSLLINNQIQTDKQQNDRINMISDNQQKLQQRKNPQQKPQQKKNSQQVVQKDIKIQNGTILMLVQDNDTRSMCSNTSRMSGASNFERVLKYQDTNQAKQQVKQTLQLQGHGQNQNDLEFMQEDNQWASILKFNNYLQKKREVIIDLKVIYIIQNQKIKKDYQQMLDIQVNEKMQRKQQKRQDEQEYHQTMIQQQIMDEKKVKILFQDQLYQIEQKNKEYEVKQIRDQLVDIKKKQEKYELKREKIQEQNFVNQLKYELKVEKEFQTFKKQNLKEIQQRFRAETLERQKLKQQQRQREIEEENEFQHTYQQILQDQEREQDELEKERQAKNNEFSIQVKKTVLNDHKMKIEKIENKTQRYQDRQDQKVKQREIDDYQSKKNQQLMIKNYLQNQMKDNEIKKNLEQDEIKLQAQVWKRDTEDFYNYEKKQKNARSKMLKMNQEQIINQIEKKQVQSKPQNDVLEIQDVLLDEQLNREIQDLQVQILD